MLVQGNPSGSGKLRQIRGPDAPIRTVGQQKTRVMPARLGSDPPLAGH